MLKDFLNPERGWFLWLLPLKASNCGGNLFPSKMKRIVLLPSMNVPFQRIILILVSTTWLKWLHHRRNPFPSASSNMVLPPEGAYAPSGGLYINNVVTVLLMSMRLQSPTHIKSIICQNLLLRMEYTYLLVSYSHRSLPASLNLLAGSFLSVLSSSHF